MITGYTHALYAADTVLSPHRYRPEPPPAPATPAVFATSQHALDWCGDELANAVAVCRQAWTLGADTACWYIAYHLRGYFFLTRTIDAWITTHRLALDAACRTGQDWAEAATRNNLGLGLMEQGQTTAADAEYAVALKIFTRLDDRIGQATTLGHQAWSRYTAGDDAAALRLGRLSIDRYDGQPRGHAITLRTVALAEARLKLYADATADLHTALGMFGELGLPSLDTAMTLNCLGEVYGQQHLYLDARRAHARAMTAGRACDSRYEQARAYAGLGLTAEAQGRRRAAVRLLTLARRIYESLGERAEAARIAERLAGAQAAL